MFLSTYSLKAYKITVVFSDGSKTVLRKTYEEFVNLQVSS